MNTKGGEIVVNNEALMEFKKSGYVMRGFLPNLEDFVEEEIFIQESTRYVK